MKKRFFEFLIVNTLVFLVCSVSAFASAKVDEAIVVYDTIVALKNTTIANEDATLFEDDTPEICRNSSIEVEYFIRQYAREFEGGNTRADVARAIDMLIMVMYGKYDHYEGDDDGVFEPFERKALEASLLDTEKRGALKYLYCLAILFEGVPRH